MALQLALLAQGGVERRGHDHQEDQAGEGNDQQAVEAEDHHEEHHEQRVDRDHGVELDGGPAPLVEYEAHAQDEGLHEQDERAEQQGDDEAGGLAGDQVGEVRLLHDGEEGEEREGHRGDEEGREHDGEYAEDLVCL